MTLFFVNFTLAQSVSGTVTNAENEPLVGASVVVKGTSNGTTTDLDDMFSLDGVETGALLTISYTGYEDMEVAAGNNLDIVLSEGLTSIWQT